MKCRQTMLHVECRTINHFFRLDKRIKIEITSYSYNFEIVVYSFFDKNIFSFSNKAKLKLKHFSFFVHGFRFLLLCKILSQPRWHQMLQPSLFSIPFPKFEGNLRLSIENQEKRAELLNSLSLLRLRSEVKNRPSSNGLARFLRDESGSSEGLV